jgi:hypothetical protein
MQRHGWAAASLPLLSALPRFRCGSTCHRPAGGIRTVGTPLVTSFHAGVDTSVITLWLGHASVRSTDAYLHADITIKEKALALTTPTSARPGRYRPQDKVLAFLESL